MRLRQVLSAKIHRATIIEANINYVGSITIDADLLERVGMLENELVHVWNVTNGECLETYVIAGPPGSGVICMNGSAALRCQVGHIVIIAAFAFTDEPIVPKVAFVDADNRFSGLRLSRRGQV